MNVGPDLDPNYLQRLSAETLAGKELKSYTQVLSLMFHPNIVKIWTSGWSQE